jgi:hypothetical protein
MSDQNIILDAFDTASEHIWSEPDMTIIDNQKPPPNFPVETLGGWREWTDAAAASASAPVDYVAVSLLAVMSSVIGNSRWVSPWDGWTEPTILWTALIGNPSSGKSPGIDVVLALVRELEGDMAQDFPDRLAKWETDFLTAKAHRATWESVVKDACEKGWPSPQRPDKAAEPERPVQDRIVVTDATIESLARLLSQHSRGLLYYRDELSGWLESFDRYSNGGDRAFWIEAFGGRSYTVDRLKNDNPLRVPYLSISVVGGIQPDKLNKLLMTGDDDGLASRLLMSWPRPVPPKRPTMLPDNSTALRAVRRLHALEMCVDDDDNPNPTIVMLAPDAVDLLCDWRIRNAQEQEWASGLFLSHLGKMAGMTLRLSLIIEYLDWSLLPEGTPEPDCVSASTYRKAMRLVDEYFLPMAERAYGDAGLPKAQKQVVMLAREIMKRRPEMINVRNVVREWKIPGLKEAQLVSAACKELVDANWLDPAPTRTGDRQGQNRKDFKVNPKLWDADGHPRQTQEI